MDCPRAHEWYELERGTASREDVDRLRRHLSECDDCRAKAEQHRNLAASLESLAERFLRLEPGEERGGFLLPEPDREPQVTQ